MSRLLFNYAAGIMKLGSQKYLVQEDLWAVSRCASQSFGVERLAVVGRHASTTGLRKAAITSHGDGGAARSQMVVCRARRAESGHISCCAEKTRPSW